MEDGTKEYLLIGIGLLILVISAIVFFVTTTSTSPVQQQEILEECKTLKYNGPKAINLLFISDRNEAEKYKDYFLESTPINENQEIFNFYYIDDYEPVCQLYKGIAILCHSRELIKKAASCPNDFIIVLSDNPEKIRSSSYLNVLSINTRHLFTVLLHEFGHAFANLAEEYTPAKLPRNQPNCKSSCSEFQSQIDGCFQECSDVTYFRSVENGVMRTLTPDNSRDPFGVFNSNIIRDLITDILEKEPNTNNQDITGRVIDKIASCKEQSYNLVEVSPIGKINEITEHTGCVGGNGNGVFSYEVTQDGELIETGNINLNIYTEVQSQGDEQISGEIFSGESAFITTTTEGNLIEFYDEEGNLIDSDNIDKVGALPCQV